MKHQQVPRRPGASLRLYPSTRPPSLSPCPPPARGPSPRSWPPISPSGPTCPPAAASAPKTSGCCCSTARGAAAPSSPPAQPGPRPSLHRRGPACWPPGVRGQARLAPPRAAGGAARCRARPGAADLRRPSGSRPHLGDIPRPAGARRHTVRHHHRSVCLTRGPPCRPLPLSFFLGGSPSLALRL